MLGTDKSRGYCLEMICADFLAGANLDNGNPEILLNSMTRFFQFLPSEQRQQFPAARPYRSVDKGPSLQLPLIIPPKGNTIESRAGQPFQGIWRLPDVVRRNSLPIKVAHAESCRYRRPCPRIRAKPGNTSLKQ